MTRQEKIRILLYVLMLIANLLILYDIKHVDYEVWADQWWRVG